jgi:hypothetical protein
VLSPDTIRFLEGGCALIVGLADADGMPHATRGWGLDVIDPERSEARLLLPAEDEVAAQVLRRSMPIAVTGCDVSTLRSMQLKGQAEPVEPQQAADPARARRYADAFFGDIHRVDGTPMELLERMLPESFLVCRFRVHERFDQTPGPAAGEPLVAEPR